MSDDLIDKQWRPGNWRGLEKLTCVICQWDTLHGMAAAQEHAANCPRCHPPVEVPAAAVIPIADKYGKEIKGG